MRYTIITPSYNAINFIEQAIESVRSQTFKDWEHIIIDGGSNDGTVELLKSYPHLNWISEPDMGIYDAMNKGINMASGEWVYFMGADDSLYSKEVLQNLNQIKNMDRYDIIVGDAYFTHTRKKYPGNMSSIEFLQRNFCHQAILYKKKIFNRLGFFNTRYKSLADYAHNMLWFNNKKIKKLYVPVTIANYYDNGYSWNYTDHVFTQDFDQLIKSNFSKFQLLAYKYYNHRGFKYIVYYLGKAEKWFRWNTQ